ncbi:SIR2 family protein [Leeuwenhoekiella parthenopeia]|uniref:SIR2 family protein n=1 Tax=Leeuwenhoekiella parthenopeia TaxID=2890320 RepID=A0ABS8GSE6_9FLAO|nr:SIR2 family protein [Leeuwenhoekiella parthenopeia]MCC4212711.1 SIR2 family protein [Leeuwenhoekiella parthenopeia]
MSTTIRPNSEIINEIRDNLISGTFPDVIPFVGAGSSFPLNLPSWKDLVVDYFKAVNCQLDFDQLRRRYSEDWAIIADVIFSETGESLEEYMRFMSERFHPDSCRFTDLHMTIVENYQRVITTNYDTAFEEVLLRKQKDPNYSAEAKARFNYSALVYPSTDLNPINFHGRCLAYLHGRHESSYVFRKREYDLAYENSDTIETFLKAVIQKFPLIFLGFSFEDKVFRLTLEKIVRKEKLKALEVQKVHGDVGKLRDIPGLYVMIRQSEINEKLSEDEFHNFFSDVNLAEISVSFTRDSDGNYEIVLNQDIKKIVNELTPLMDSEKLEEFQDWIIKNEKRKQRNQYFKSLNFEVIGYSNHSDVATLLEEIMIKSVDFEEGLNNLPDTA